MKKVYLFVCILLTGITVQAQKVWTGAAGDTTWNTAGNWNPSGVPTSTDSVVFNNTGLQIVYFTADASAKIINFRGNNVMFAIKGGAAGTVVALQLGGTSSGNYSQNALQFTGNLGSLTLNTNRSSGAGCGINLTVLAGNKITVTKTINLSGYAPTLPTVDSISASQVNKIIGIDAGSVQIASGAEIRVNQRNNGTGGVQVFNGSATNGIVFNSGSILTNITANHLDPFFPSTSGAGCAQFLSGSRFNASAGATTISGFSANYIAGRTYGTFNVGNISQSTNAVFQNTSTTATSFLDSFIVNSANSFNITLTSAPTIAATYNFNNIRVASTAATPSTNIYFRASNTAGAPNLSVNISGNVNIASTALNTNAGTINIYFGPNGTAGSTASTDIYFTGTTNLTITKGALSTLVNPGIIIGAPSGGATMPTSFTIKNGATLNLGDSLTLRGAAGSQANTKFTINPTGRLTLIDNAVLTTNHNNNFNIESSAAGTGTIGEGNGTIINSGTVQRFIKGNAAWRLVGIPFSLSTKIKGGNSLSSAANLFLNNIFDQSHVYGFNDTLDNGKYGVGAGVNAGWTKMASENDSIQPYKGLLIYGSRGIGDQIVSFTGFFNNGDVTIPLSKIPNNKGWNLIANPYVSNIDFNTIAQNPANDGVLLSNTVYGVNPIGGGGYSFTSYVASTGIGVNGGSRIIENGAAFFVKAADIGKSLVIRQSDKTNATVNTTAGGVTLLGSGSNYSSIKISLNGANNQSDEVAFVWGTGKTTDGFDDKLDAYDLGANGTHDLAIVDNNGTRYSIFNGTDLQKNTDRLSYKLAIKNLLQGTYSFTVTIPKALDKSNEAYLIDNYLGTSVLVQAGLLHNFQVTQDAASKSEGRFQLEIRKK